MLASYITEYPILVNLFGFELNNIPSKLVKMDSVPTIAL